MKTTFTILVSLCISFNAVNAQWINSLTVKPANPNINDTIYILADCSFPSGSCDQHFQVMSVNQNTIYASSVHCLGMLTFICDATDTFAIAPLPAGNYNFVYHVDYGALPAPCNPGINPGPTDSVSFTVTSTSGLPLPEEPDLNFNVYPNPAKDILNVTSTQDALLNKNLTLIVYAITGKEILRSTITSKEQKIDIVNWLPGSYLIRISGDNLNEKHLVEVNK